MRKGMHWIAAGLFGLSALAHAGQTCETTHPSASATQSAIQLATKLQAALDGSGADVALVARAGQDLRRYNLRYSHMAVAYKDPDHARWTLLHKLNDCGTEQAGLHRQGLGNFFLDDPHAYRARLYIPSAAMQKSLLAVMRDQRHRWVDEPRYSAIAYPWAQRYQNSNGWVLELLALADAPSMLRDRREAQAHLRATGYQPGEIPIGPAERAGASLTRANVSFMDHPLAKRLAGRYQVVTVESVESWLTQRGQLLHQQDLGL